MAKESSKETIEHSTGQIKSQGSKAMSSKYGLLEAVGDVSDRNLYHLPDGAKAKNKDGVEVEIPSGWYRIDEERAM
ncbi:MULTISPECIES: hypothetical protein [Xanthomonas]|uniref:hypothetical protein n=1 Tax=Xanthomonas TaxID=338 RepID=UPI000E1E447E|nr:MULTISPECIES: hypothetical protein [Xanthomonas]